MHVKKNGGTDSLICAKEAGFCTQQPDDTNL